MVDFKEATTTSETNVQHYTLENLDWSRWNITGVRPVPSHWQGCAADAMHGLSLGSVVRMWSYYTDKEPMPSFIRPPGNLFALP
jgi:hypothetical protein